MGVEGVMVSYHHSGPEESAGILTVSASGVQFSPRWVLTHGSVLSPLAIAQDVLRSRGKPILNDRFYANLPEMYITCEAPEPTPADPAASAAPAGRRHRRHYEALARLSQRRADPPADDLDHPTYQVRVLTGRVCHVWQCPVLERCVEETLHGWTIGLRDADLHQQPDLGRALLSVFLLIDLHSHVDVRDPRPLRPLSELLDAVEAPPARGGALLLHSTPFGCEVFLNSETRGTVCGAVGARPSLLLTDAASALGCEGAPVFAGPRRAGEARGGLVGMVACSVAWWRGEWVGLTLVAPLRTVLQAKLRLAPDPRAPALVGRPELHRTLERIDRGTVLVRCGAAWGAGVYLGLGYVLTCAHVVRRHATDKLSVYCGGARATAILRYKTRDELAYDLALLFTNPGDWPHLQPARLALTDAVKGEPVAAAGYPYFTERSVAELRPTVTSGHVTNTSPSMIQTSCCVQSGFSGGAVYRLLEDSDGCEVVGVIVSNARTQQTDACYPFVNMAVPTRVFRSLLNNYLQDRSEEKLRAMESKRELVQAQWRLLPYRSKI